MTAFLTHPWRYIAASLAGGLALITAGHLLNP